MIELRGLKVLVTAPQEKLEQMITKKLRLKKVPEYRILKRSIDARKKPDIFYIYNIGVELPNEEQILQKVNDKDIMLTDVKKYEYPATGEEELSHHPLIIGAGPAGLFCGFLLAKMGYAPIIVERGSAVDERITTVEAFFKGEPLDPECNIQFGEGGAGTFSDGKLNTQVKDKYGRIRYVLETFVNHGAPEAILYDNKPHVGTDLLVKVVKGIREEIEESGGRFLFHTKAIDFRYDQRGITEVKLQTRDYETWVQTNVVVFAIGHSARDTFEVLYNKQVNMLAKDFAMGVRVEHPASWIQKAMYGESKASNILPAAPYKLTYQTSKGRGVYSFCMCPGGYVVNASSELEHTAVNGMSYSGRDGKNSNSAIIVTVRKEDFESDHPLAGVSLQRQLEHNMYLEGKGTIVVQRFADFKQGIPTTKLGKVEPQMKGKYSLGNVASNLPQYMTDAIIEGIDYFETKIAGFSDDDAILSGVESRTSSPVRITRDESFQANITGLYPCGEGAGYAGGIMSAAMDGMKVAEAIIHKYKPGFKSTLE